MEATAVVAMERAATMRAVLRTRYGRPEVLELGEVEKPELEDDRVLVRVRAASLNRADWYEMTGTPLVARPMMGGLLRPKSPLIGGDFAGIAEAVGKDVAGIEPGDEVFGSRLGALAEYVSARMVERKPANLTFEEAAAVPLAAVTALQGLRDHGHVRPGHHVLIDGAGGGVGNFAVQIARALGAAHVNAVCGPRNVELVRSLGADRVFDYTREDFTGNGHYDVILDVNGTSTWTEYRRVLNRDGVLVVIGAPLATSFLGPIARLGRTMIASKLAGGQKAKFFIAKWSRSDLAALRELVESGQVKPVIERRYRLSEVADALRYMGTGHVRGKLVISV
jgi:NADPH:quinone reductase-like Zn-dependent oxidoreductase